MLHVEVEPSGNQIVTSIQKVRIQKRSTKTNSKSFFYVRLIFFMFILLYYHVFYLIITSFYYNLLLFDLFKFLLVSFCLIKEPTLEHRKAMKNTLVLFCFLQIFQRGRNLSDHGLKNPKAHHHACKLTKLIIFL